MIKAWLRYLSLLIIVSALYVFYVGYISYFLFLLILSLPILSLVLYILATWRFELQLHTSSTIIHKHSEQEITLRSRTNVWVPLAKVEADVQIYNHFHNTTANETLYFTSEAGFSDVEMLYDFSTCGKYTITISTLYVYDILHLFKKKKKVALKLDVFVLPNPTQITEELFFTPQLGEEEFDKHRPGNDPGETFDVHEYRAGDSLHKVHWKLSAKLGKTMIRETSMPIAKHVKLYFDLYGTNLDGDDILAQVYGCSTQLLSAQYEHDILQYETGICMKETHITSSEELVMFLCDILSKRASMSATSSLHSLSLGEDSIFVQKNQVLTHVNQKGGEANASTK